MFTPPAINTTYRAPRIFIKVTGAPTGSAYPWTQQVQSLTAGTWQDDTNAPYGPGTAASFPAYMADGSTSVASGTICEAEVNYAGFLIAWPIGQADVPVITPGAQTARAGWVSCQTQAFAGPKHSYPSEYASPAPNAAYSGAFISHMSFTGVGAYTTSAGVFGSMTDYNTGSATILDTSGHVGFFNSKVAGIVLLSGITDPARTVGVALQAFKNDGTGNIGSPCYGIGSTWGVYGTSGGGDTVTGGIITTLGTSVPAANLSGTVDGGSF